MSKERIAIIGGGAYGLALAKEFASEYDTTLLEQQSIFGNATSSHNQARLQEGYLYAPDPTTAIQCHRGAERIRQQFPESLLPQETSYYLFVNESNFTGAEFEAFCQNLRLPLRNVRLTELEDRIHQDKIASAYEVAERNIDIGSFLASLAKKAQVRGANLFTNAQLQGVDRTPYGDISIRTNRGELEVDILINAAGPWLGQVGKMMGYEIPTELLKTTFYEVNKIMFPESYTFVFHRSKGGTIIPNSAMGVTMLGRGDVNTEVDDPSDVTPITNGGEKTLDALKSISKLLDTVQTDQLCPITGTKVRIKSAEGLRESSVIEHEHGLYSVVGGKLTSSLYIAEKVKKEVTSR